VVSIERVKRILGQHGISIADLASNPDKLNLATAIIYGTIPIPVRWFVGRKRVRRTLGVLAGQAAKIGAARLKGR